MRLDFNVLWVEDQPNNVNAQQVAINTAMRREGFCLSVQFASSVDEATNFLSNDIYGDHIDLILMDYDLGAGKTGDEGLSEVRNIFLYKDIIFYSGRATADLKNMINEQNVQGVYTSNRNDLPDSVIGVFDNLVRKVLDIDHSRGIVMGATSDIDQILNSALCKTFDDGGDAHRAALIGAVKKRAAEKREQIENTLQAIENIAHVSELMNHHAVYTSDDRLRLFSKLLKERKLHTEHTEKMNNYRETIVPKRNDLAHIKVEQNGFSRKFYDRKGNVLTGDDMRALRVDLLEFRELFDQLFGNASS